MEKFTFFWRGRSPFSQWYRCSFKAQGKVFNCTEQYMMYCKSLLFKDIETANKILASTNPKEQKDLGRAVKDFDFSIWDKKKYGIVYMGNYHKFSQNQNLKNILLGTKGTTLVEASPYDTIWGIGLDENDPLAKDRSNWRGQNLLGQILTQLREDIICSDSIC